MSTHAEPLPACDLLLLLAAREARLMALSDGTLSDTALADWEDGLSEAECAALDQFDRLICTKLKHLHAAHRAVGV
jgi:hypothetical protein